MDGISSGVGSVLKQLCWRALDGVMDRAGSDWGGRMVRGRWRRRMEDGGWKGGEDLRVSNDGVMWSGKLMKVKT